MSTSFAAPRDPYAPLLQVTHDCPPPFFCHFNAPVNVKKNFLQERVCKDKGDRTVETEIMSACVQHTHEKRKDGESKMEKAEKKRL